MSFEFRNHSEIRETCGYQRDTSIISGTRPGTVRYGSENLNTGRSNACLLCWTVPGKPGTVRCTRYWYQYQVVTGMPFRRRSNMSTEEFTRFYNYTRVFPSRQKTQGVVCFCYRALLFLVDNDSSHRHTVTAFVDDARILKNKPFFLKNEILKNFNKFCIFKFLLKFSATEFDGERHSFF